VFARVCFRAPANPTERSEVTRIAEEVFVPSNYDLREAFAAVAQTCMDD
jgi:hypothetical protein